MFPFVQFSKRPWLGSLMLLGCLALQSMFSQTPTPTNAAPDDVTYIHQMESHLESKANKVLDRFTSESYTVDLSLVLDPTRKTTTIYQPGEKVLVANQEKQDGAQCVRSQSWELTGTWEELTDDARPKIQTLRCCVTLPKGSGVDHDHLYRCLSYALGVDLKRGDILQIVEI